jgi:hypothetical protein
MEEIRSLETSRASPRGQTFAEVMANVKAEADKNHPDVVLPLRDLRMDPTGLLEVGSRSLQPTDWSEHQLASLLGVRWGRWFGPVGGDEMAEEVNRRLKRSDRQVRVRSRALGPNGGPGDGELRAVLSGSYAPIDDARVFELMDKTREANLSEMTFIRVTRTDRSSHYVGLQRSSFDLGNGSGVDRVYPGIHLRNSEVGFAALTLEIAVLRLVCTNGLVIPIAGVSLYRMHRKLRDEVLEAQLRAAFDQFPAASERTMTALRRSRESRLDAADAAIVEVLTQAEAPRDVERRVREAFAHEGDSTTWGLVQAVTSVARDLLDPDLRYSLERAAGRLLSA